MSTLLLVSLIWTCASWGETLKDGEYRIALPEHKGQLSWFIDGYKIVENSAKPDGSEIGVRGRDASGQRTFLGFLFLVREASPMTGARCREAVLAEEKKANGTLKIITTAEIPRSDALPVALVAYSTANRDGSLAYRVRGFVAANDLCGDLEFYSGKPIGDDDPSLKKAFLSFQLDVNHVPQFSDVALFAEILFRKQQYRAAAPMFEKCLAMVPPNGAPFKSAKFARRVMRDQAGMSYGISGDLVRSRSIFEKGTSEDPDYPMYYYNLACADAGEQKLAEARVHLQQAFDRKANVNPSEAMPAPTEDDSFTPFKGNKEFWAFLKRLEAGK
ncbi:MAG: hypothetical protein ABI693_31505 [Bryobacteraceae bacterium]